MAPPAAEPEGDGAEERLDLHVHSTWSSGFCAAAELVRWASMADVRSLAITDHHHVEAYAEALPAAVKLGVALVPGVELDCVAGERRVDLLGYWIDPAAPALAAFLRRWPGGTHQVLEDLSARAALARALGVDLDPARLTALSDGRPPSFYWLMALLTELGWAPTLGAAFARWNALRAAGSLPRMARRYASVEEGAEAIRAAGGVVALAHPALIRDDATAARLVAAGVVDAVESPYGGYWTEGVEKNARYRRLAEEHGLPTSAGSDFHAYPFSDLRLGMTVAAGTLERLHTARAVGTARLRYSR